MSDSFVRILNVKIEIVNVRRGVDEAHGGFSRLQ
jgi:hypothetical protein